MPIFAEAVLDQAEKLGTMGSQALLGVGVLALTVCVGVLFRIWRSDVKKMQVKHDAEKKEQRAEYTTMLKEMSEAIRQLSGESKANANAINQLANESKANTAAIINRLDRLEMHLPDTR